MSNEPHYLYNVTSILVVAGKTFEFNETFLTTSNEVEFGSPDEGIVVNASEPVQIDEDALPHLLQYLPVSELQIGVADSYIHPDIVSLST